MDDKLKAKWVKALRSGKYKQGKNCLRSLDNKFCCLGVLCDVMGRRWYRAEESYAVSDDGIRDTGGEDDERLICAVGGPSTARELINLNDTEAADFGRIADHIEKTL